MATKEKALDNEQLLAALKKKIEEDRQRLSGFLTKLISSVDAVDDPLTVISAADSVAKIGDTLTRQNHLTIEALKVLSKKDPKGKTEDDIFSEVGRPFSLEDDDDASDKDGSN